MLILNSFNCCCCSVTKLCLAFCKPMDSSLPCSSVHGISQARILEQVPFPSPGVFPDQGSNLCLLHWQVTSLPLSQSGKPLFILFYCVLHLNTREIYSQVLNIQLLSWEGGKVGITNAINTQASDI